MWEVQPKAQDSWLWKKLLWVRDRFEQLTYKVIGNGRATSFWYDPWHPWGILIKKFPELRQKFNIGLDAKVSDVIRRRQWSLPYGRGWDSQVIEFNSACRGLSITNREDHWKWIPSSHFSISSATTANLPPQSPLP